MRLSRTFTRSRWVAVAALAATAVLPMAAQAAGGAAAAGGCDVTPDKCYSFSMSTAGTPAVGDEAVYTGTLKNLSAGGAGITLGSANITWSPANAFYSVTAGSVSVSPAGSGTPTEAVNGAKIELRNLGAAPGATVTFTFKAVALRAGTITWSSEAKQANNFLGLNNALTQVSADPTTSISGSCSGNIDYNAYGCSGFPIAQGGTVCTDALDSLGQPSKVTACITFPPVPGATGYQVMALRSYLDGEDCLIGDCAYVVQLLNKLNLVYAGEYSASLSIDCGDLCGSVKAFLQQEESTGTNEPLLPCAVVDAPELLGSEPLASPLTGSTACFTDNGDSVTVENISFLNDYKVMSIVEL
jgi:hypothetical protein